MKKILVLALLVVWVWGAAIGPEISITHGGIGGGLYAVEDRVIISVFVP